MTDDGSPGRANSLAARNECSAFGRHFVEIAAISGSLGAPARLAKPAGSI
jgi:hypothetical protein